MRFQKNIKSTIVGIIAFLCIVVNLTTWALPGDNHRLAKTSVRDLRYIYARYEIPITNDGRFGWDPTAQTPGGGRWLRGSDEGYIFGAGVWIGAYVDGQKQVTVGYNPMNCQTEMVPGNLPNEAGYTDATEIVYISTDYPDASLPPWPKGFDKNGNPIAVSNMDSWSQCNDLDSSRQFEGGKPLGALVTTETYSWNSAFRDVWDIAFIVYTIKNINPSQKTWEDAYIGFAMDADIGDPANDLTGCFPDLNIGFAYSSPELSGLEEGLEHPPGYVGIKFLDGPAKDPNTGEAVMSTFRRWATDFVPNSDEIRYDLLSAGTFDLEDTDAADKRIFLASGPFDLAYGESTRFVVAVCFAWPMWYHDPSVKGDPDRYADYLKLVAENAQYIYDNNFKFPQPPDLPHIRLTPQDQKIIITWDDVAEKSVEEILSLPDFSDSLDFEGYKLWKSTTGEEGSFEMLGHWDKISFDDLGNPIGKNTGIARSYVDEDLINGILYYYAVTAYDKGEYQPLNYGDPEFEVVPPMETGMVFGINLKAEKPNTPPSNFTQPQMEGLELISGDAQEIQFSIAAEYLIPDSVKDKDFQIRFSGVPPFRYDKDIEIFGPDIYLVETSIEDTIITTWNFPVGNPPTSLKSDIFDGMRLCYSGPNLVLNKIDSVYFKEPKTRVQIYPSTEYVDYYAPQTVVPTALPFGSYFSPHEYLIEFYELAGKRRANVYDLNNGDTLDYKMLSFGRTYALAGYEKIYDESSGDTIWYNNPSGFKNSITNEAVGYKIYIPGAFVFIEDPGSEVTAGDSLIIKLSGMRAPCQGDIYQFSTAARQINYHPKLDVKVVPNPYYVRAPWDIDNDYQKVQFINLPTECTIYIYTIAGDLVKTIHHKEPYKGGFDAETGGTVHWNLMTKNNQKVTTGVYVFYLDSPFGEDVGRFAIIR